MNVEEDFVSPQDIAAALSNLAGEPSQPSPVPPDAANKPSQATPLSRSGRLNDDYKALGVAVTQMMTDPSFARLGFGHWSRVLTGMINRKHYLIATEGNGVSGFLGWALTTEDIAERWLAGEGEIAYEDSLAGDCIIINAWVAKTPRTNRHLLQQIRNFGQDKRLVYFKRFYPDGRMRPMRLSATEFVAKHVEKNG